MARFQRRFVLKVVSWMIGLVVLALATIFGINATDEELTDLAKKAMVIPPVPPASPENGYTDFLALEGASIDERLRRLCRPETDQCLKYAADNPDLVQLSARDDEFGALYRTMRRKPQFVDLSDPKSPDDPLPAFQNLFQAQRRSLVFAAGMANKGWLESAIAELEAENAFHRRMAAGSRRLITRMIAFNLLHRDALFTSELARIRGERATALLARLKMIVRPLTDAEIDMRRPLDFERAQSMSWMQTRGNVRLSDNYYKAVKEIYGINKSRPWWDPAAPYLYRPHQSVNLYAAQTEVLFRVTSAPSKDFSLAQEAARAQARALAPPAMVSWLINPVGRAHPYIGLGELRDDEKLTPNLTPYIGRAHVTQALNSLVALQIELRMAGVSSLPAIGRALDGPLFAAHPEPFTGKPMRFDAKTRTIGFYSPVDLLGGALMSLEQRYGRAAVELAIDP
jgi:hypothetical protein